VKASLKSPRKLIVYSKPKTGKTSALAQIPNSLILDFDNGTDFVDAVKYKIDSLGTLKEVGNQILKEGKPYQTGIVDTVTKLEDMCIPYALKIYQETPMGKSFNGNVLTLPKGAGYYYLRMAVDKMTTYIESLFERIIYSGHLKGNFIEKNNKEVVSAELDLIGKQKGMLCADVDAIGLMYRDGDRNILSFKTSEEIICGARPEHLSNQEIVISEENDGKITTYWDRIYID